MLAVVPYNLHYLFTWSYTGGGWGGCDSIRNGHRPGGDCAHERPGKSARGWGGKIVVGTTLKKIPVSVQDVFQCQTHIM